MANLRSVEALVPPLATSFKDSDKSSRSPLNSSETDSHSLSEGPLGSPHRSPDSSSASCPMQFGTWSVLTTHAPLHSEPSPKHLSPTQRQNFNQSPLQPLTSPLAFSPVMNFFGQPPKVSGFPPISTWSPPPMFMPPGIPQLNHSYPLLLPMAMSSPIDKLPNLPSPPIPDSKPHPSLTPSLPPVSQLLPQTPTSIDSITKANVSFSLESQSIHTITEESSQADIAEFLDSMKSQADSQASKRPLQLKPEPLPPSRGNEVHIPAPGGGFPMLPFFCPEISSMGLPSAIPSMNPSIAPLGSRNMSSIPLPSNMNPITLPSLSSLSGGQSLDSSAARNGGLSRADNLKWHERRRSGSDFTDDAGEAEPKTTRPYRRRHTLKPQTPRDKEIMEKYSFKNLYLTHSAENGTLFKCHICDYSSFQVGNLQQHLYSHEGVKPFQCDECDYASAFQSALIRHMKTHTSERKFKCPECDYSVHQSYNLRRHLIKKHSKSMDEASEVIKAERLAAKHER